MTTVRRPTHSTPPDSSAGATPDATQAAPGDQRIRTFRRRGRMTAAKRAALDTLGSRYVVGLAAIAGGTAWPPYPARRRVLDIGFGDGEATVAFAGADPETATLAVEVHRPGIATLLQRLDELGLDTVRIYEGDALDVLDALGPASLDAVHVFFPDPWPKVRHHARRLVRADVVARVAELLVPGGVLHLATDAADYAAQMRAVLAAEPSFSGVTDGDRAGRIVTKYERLGLAAGRSIADLRASRR